jgi:hypothetical protein
MKRERKQHSRPLEDDMVKSRKESLDNIPTFRYKQVHVPSLLSHAGFSTNAP